MNSVRSTELPDDLAGGASLVARACNTGLDCRYLMSPNTLWNIRGGERPCTCVGARFKVMVACKLSVPGGIGMLLEDIRRHVGWIYRMRSIYLLASLILFVVLVPYFDTNVGIREKIVVNFLNMFILVAAVAAVGRTRFSFVMAVFFTLPVIGFQIAGLAFGDENYMLWSWAFGAAFYATTLMYLLRYVFSSDVMDADKLFGAAAAYMLLGLLWAYFYLISQYLNVDAFSLYGEPVAKMPAPDMIYFSYTTLTSTGFGDIAPLHPKTRALANLEQICGTLFVAILIARLAGIYPETDKKVS